MFLSYMVGKRGEIIAIAHIERITDTGDQISIRFASGRMDTLTHPEEMKVFRQRWGAFVEMLKGGRQPSIVVPQIMPGGKN